MNLALNNLQRLICHKTKQTYQTKRYESNYPPSSYEQIEEQTELINLGLATSLEGKL